MALESVIAGYEECISITHWVSKAVGLWPLDEATIIPLCKLVVMLILIVFTLIIPQTREVIIVRGDFNLMLEVLTTALINYYITLLKILTMWYYKDDLKKLLMQIHEDWRLTSTKEQIKMWSYAKMSKWIHAFIVSGPVGSASVYLIAFAISFKPNGICMNGTCIRPLYVLSDFSFDARVSPIYEIVIFSQCIAVFFVVVAFSAYDCIYVSSVLHFSGQLYNLQHRIKKLVIEHQRRRLPFVKCLEPVIQRYLHLVSHAKIIEDIFNKGFLVQVLGISVALGLQGYNFVLIISEPNSTTKFNVIFIVIFTIANLASIFVYCYNAQTLRDESEALFDATYHMNWYEMPAKDAILVAFMMKRCMKPLEITAGKFAPFTLTYFTKVVKTSAGYLSLLLAVKDKIVEE